MHPKAGDLTRRGTEEGSDDTAEGGLRLTALICSQLSAIRKTVLRRN
jgi:hypothetical protein